MAVENMGISLGGRSPPRLTPNTKQGVNLSKNKGCANVDEAYRHAKLQS